MKPKNKNQFRPSIIALYAALVALVATVVVGLIQLTIKLGMYTPPNPEAYTLALEISAIVVVLMLALYAILEPDAVRNFLTGRQARYGSNTFVMILAFAGIIVIANYLAFTNNKKLADMTEGKQNTLAPEMANALKSLPGKLQATAFFSSDMPKDDARKLLDNMKSNSGGKFDYSFVDPVADPLAAKEFGVTGDGKIVFEFEGRHEIATYVDEAEFLRAMNRLINPEARTVYFLTGHGEHDINGSTQEAMSRARETLENKNYIVKALNLLAENAVPQDAKAVIIAGPKQPLAPVEVSLLVSYVKRGGGLFVMEDPLPFTDFGDKPDPLAEALESNWGIRLRDDFVVDTASNDPYYAVGASFNSSHPISQSSSLVAFLHFTRSIEFSSQPEGVTQTAVVQTSSNASAWGETDFSPLQGGTAFPSFDTAADIQGPLILVASAETGASRVVAIGNSNFATDKDFEIYGNGDLFINSVDWTAGQEGAPDITPKDVTQRIYNPPSQLAGLAVLLGSVCLIPGLVLAAGVWAWFSRRRKG